MRVLIVNHYAKPPSQAGGTRHFMLAREWVTRGHEVTILACGFNHLTKRTEVEYGRGRVASEEADGVVFIWLPAPGYTRNGPARVANLSAFALRVATKGGRLAGSHDVVVGSTPDLLSAAAALRIARRSDKPFVLELRDIWPRTWVDVGGMRAGNPVVTAAARLEQHLYRQADHIVSLLPYAAEHVRTVAGRPCSVTWVPNGVRTSELPVSPPPPDSGTFTITYAGAMGVANALDQILDAAALLMADGSPVSERIRFRLVGEGPLRNALKNRVRREHLTNVELVHAVPKSEVHTLLAGSDALVAVMRNSDLYRFGMSINKMYDYLAAARPVLFACGSRNNPVEEAGAGITVPPEEPAHLAAAAAELAALPLDERRQLGLRGRAFVEREHDAPVLAGRFEQALLSVLRTGQGGGTKA